MNKLDTSREASMPCLVLVRRRSTNSEEDFNEYVVGTYGLKIAFNFLAR